MKFHQKIGDVHQKELFHKRSRMDIVSIDIIEYIYSTTELNIFIYTYIIVYIIYQ